MPIEAMRKAVGPIPATPLGHGLLSAASVVDVADRHELLGVDFPQRGCGPSHDTDWCPPGGGDVPVKEFNRVEWGTAAPVTIYHGSECSTVGFTFDDARDDAREGLLLGEARALEEWYMTTVLATASTTDVTPVGGPVSVAQSIGVLEGELSQVYGGIGVLHVPTGLSSMLAQAGQYDFNAERRRTWLGNVFALGAGYQANLGPDGTEAPAGQAWLYATGPVVIRRGAVEDVPPSEPGSLDLTDNNRYVLTERTSVIQTACVVLATLTNIACEC